MAVCHTTPRRQAFSLLELTVVILLLGVMAAIGTPHFSDSVRLTRLHAAARQMAAHIDYIRRTAVNQGSSTTLVCNNSNHWYGSGNVAFPERPSERIYVSLPAAYDPSFTLAADFDSRAELLFDFEGVPKVGSSPLRLGTISIASGRDQYLITIAPGTGRTTVTHVVHLLVDSSDDAPVGATEDSEDSGDGDVDGTSGATP